MSADNPLTATLSVDDHRTCRNCGAHVQKRTARVYGDRENVLHHCGNCPDICPRDLRQGAGSNPDYDPAVDRGDTSDNHPIFPDRGDGQ